MGTKNSPGKFDCYANAEPDEPMFVLLARDKHAPTLVWLWGVLRELDGEDPEKVREAQTCCVNMIEWAHDHNRKVCGLGQSALAAVCELIRAANYASEKESKNAKTDVDVMRLWLAATKVEKSDA